MAYRSLEGLAQSQEFLQVEIGPLTVTPAYEKLSAALRELTTQLESLPNSIQSKKQWHEAKEFISELQRTSNHVLSGFEEVYEHLDSLRKEADSHESELGSLLNRIRLAWNLEVARFQGEMERVQKEKEEADQARDSKEKVKAQRETDLLALRMEITAARQVADNAERSGELKTAQEIRQSLMRFANLDSSPGSFTHPAQDAKQVRRSVAVALRNEIRDEG